MSPYLFAYGTLQPGLAPESMTAVVAAFEPVGEGYARGVLYDLGHYPGAVLRHDSDGRVYGTVFRLPNDPSLFEQLDEYEDFDPRSPETSQFVRILCPVTLATGDTLPCWVYVYNRETDSARVLASGRFR